MAKGSIQVFGYTRLNTGEEYILKEIGECELRGKDENIKLKTVRKI